MLLQCRHPHRTQPFLPPPAFIFIYKIHNQFIFPHIDMQPLMPNSLSPHPSCRKRFLYSNKKLILTEIFFLTYSPSGTVGCLLQNTHKIISQETMEIQKSSFLHAFVLSKTLLGAKIHHHICKCIMKSVFLMQNLNALVYYRPGKINEATFFLFFCQLSITASLLSPFGNKISGSSNFYLIH